MGKVVIIEDDPLLQKVYSTRLKADGHQVFIASNGKKGLQMVKKELPQVVLLDIMMPRISGLDVLKQLKSNSATAEIPVLVYSNLGKQEKIIEAKKMGAQEFITKANFTPQQVVAKIEAFL